MTALRGLFPLDEASGQTSEDFDRTLREVAEQALNGIAVTLKHLLTAHGPQTTFPLNRWKRTRDT